jgi:hypothetical protein
MEGRVGREVSRCLVGDMMTDRMNEKTVYSTH